MLTLNELFAGIGSQSAALERLGIEHEVVGIAEIDKDATLSYAAIHCDLANKIKTYDFPSNQEMAQYLTDRNIGYDFKKNKPRNWFKGVLDKISGKAARELKRYYLASILSNNYGDISKIEKLDYADFWTYSFPCQDISVAGKQAGIEHGKTRSGLLYEVERLLEVAQEHNELPKYLMLENVKNLVGKKFKPQFEEWITRLDELGYNTYWQVLNSKNYGIPQNRERVFGISIRKDIDTGYVFPEPFELKTRLKDILEKEADEKYYISNEKTKALTSKLKGNLEIGTLLQERNGTFGKIDARSINGCSPSITSTCYKGPDMIVEPKISGVGNINPSGNGMNGNVFSQEGLSPTIILPVTHDYRIRKLTPLECWRLMGFKDEQFYKAEKVNSNSQLYKQAGNSIVVDVLYYLFKNLFIDKPVVKQTIEENQSPGQMNIADFLGGAQ